MNKKDLKKELTEIISQIKANSKDAVFAEKLAKKLVAVKGQMDVEAVEISVSEKEVVKRYDFSSYEYIRCKSCIIFHVHGGVYTIVRPTMTALYQALEFLLDSIDSEDTLDEPSKNALESIQTAYAFVLQAPIVVSLEDESLNDVAVAVVKCFERVQKNTLERLEATEETEEDYKKNAEFENEQAMYNMKMEDKKDA